MENEGSKSLGNLRGSFKAGEDLLYFLIRPSKMLGLNKPRTYSKFPSRDRMGKIRDFQNYQKK